MNSPMPEHQAPAEVRIDLPEAAMHLYKPNDPVTVRVHATAICTASRKAAAFVRHVELDFTGTRLAGACLPGQSIGVIPPGVDASGKPHKVRLYSIASPATGEDGRGNIIAVTVKRAIDEHHDHHRLFLGVASNFLCDLAPGDQVQCTGPSGKRFLLPARPDEHEYLFFATGTGIAPFRGMVLDLLRARVPGRVVLVMGSPYATDLIYHDEFTRLAGEHPNFVYLTAVSRHEQPDGKPRMYVQERLRHSADLLGGLLASPRALVYVCGLTGMELGIFQEMARTLPPEVLAQYLDIDPDVAADPASWERRMIHRQVRPSRRIFLEVYD